MSIHVGFSKVTLDFAEFVLVLNSCFWHDLYSELISTSPCLELSRMTLAGKVDIAVIITAMSAWASALLLDVCQNFQWAFLFCILWFNLPNSITPWDLCSHLISYKKKTSSKSYNTLFQNHHHGTWLQTGILGRLAELLASDFLTGIYFVTVVLDLPMLRLFNTVTPNHKITSFLLHNCHIVMLLLLLVIMQISDMC